MFRGMECACYLLREQTLSIAPRALHATACYFNEAPPIEQVKKSRWPLIGEPLVGQAKTVPSIGLCNH